MTKKIIKIITIATSVLIFSSGVSYARSLEEIYKGKKPSVRITTDQLADLITYSKYKFKDISDRDWFVASVSKLYGMKGINGYEDQTFKADNKITTGEFTKTLIASFGNVMEISPKVWYQNYVTKAKELGVIENKDNYNFETGMLRKDMAKMICKILELNPSTSSTAIFTDTKGIDTKWIDKAYSEYLIRGYVANGIKTFAPNGTATRAEACTMIINALEYKEDNILYKNIKINEVKEQESQSLRLELENKIKAGETTTIVAGFKVPIFDKSNLYTSSSLAEKYGKTYPLISFILHAPGERNAEIIERERNQLKEVLIQKFEEKLSTDIVEYINQKKAKNYSLVNKWFYGGDLQIRVGCGEEGIGELISVDIYYK